MELHVIQKFYDLCVQMMHRALDSGIGYLALWQVINIFRKRILRGGAKNPSSDTSCFLAGDPYKFGAYCGLDTASASKLAFFSIWYLSFLFKNTSRASKMMWLAGKLGTWDQLVGMRMTLWAGSGFKLPSQRF